MPRMPKLTLAVTIKKLAQSVLLVTLVPLLLLVEHGQRSKDEGRNKTDETNLTNITNLTIPSIQSI